MGDLLKLVRAHRAARKTEIEHLTDLELFTDLVNLLSGGRSDCPAIARLFAVWFALGPDYCTEAVALLRDGGFGAFEEQELRTVRRHPAYAEFGAIVRQRTLQIDEETFLRLRDLAITAGSV